MTAARGGKVLVVDDDPALAEMLGIVLRGEGFEPSFVADGDAALGAFRRERPDLVLLDAMMPGMSGFDVCQVVRANDELRATKILMLTAKGRDTDLARGSGVGVDAYVTKPFSTKELASKVRELLARDS